MHEATRARRRPVGAEMVPVGGEFHVWALGRRKVEVVPKRYMKYKNPFRSEGVFRFAVFLSIGRGNLRST
jgi:hypothetical protein